MPRRALILVLVALAAACDRDATNDDASSNGSTTCAPDNDASEGPIGPMSGAICPDDNTLSYDNFGKAFMEKYCTRCHSSTLMTPAERMCAPLYHDFDTLDGILPVADHIDEYAAAGPDATNTNMPLGSPQPTDEERQQLGQWLACELAAM